MTRAPASVLFVIVALALTGCGAQSAAPSPSRSAAGPAGTGTAPAIASTAGRTGPAYTERNGERPRRLSAGGAIPGRAPQPGGARHRGGLGAGAACADADLAPTSANLVAVASASLCLLNGERTDRGLVALTANPLLAAAAREHAGDMVAKQYFAHDGLDGSTMRDRVTATGYLRSSSLWTIGENLAWGTGALATPQAIMNSWMASPGHRENILNPAYREIGYGVVAGNPAAPTGLGATYATEFGAVTAQTPAAATAATAQPAAATGATRTPATKASSRKARARKARARRARARAARVRTAARR